MHDAHTDINRDHWNDMAADWVAAGEEAWASARPFWGIWELPEADLRLLPEGMTGLDAIELGCGTGYVSSWMARRGARVTGVDISREQLATARRLNDTHAAGIDFREADAQSLPDPDQSFDFAISEYGAAIWCDPHVWLREAHRLLRPGGRLVFLGHHPLVYLCTPEDGAACDTTLHRPYRGMHRQDWTEVPIDPGGIEFNLGFADWMDLFARIGFRVERYQELYAPDGATGAQYGIPAEWSRQFPCEQVWHLLKPA